MAEGAQPRFNRRLRERAILDLGTFPPAGTRVSGFLSCSPSPASTRRSEAEVLSRAKLMGDGQAGVWARKEREEETLAEEESVMPE